MSDPSCDSTHKNNCCDARMAALEKRTARLCCWLTCIIIVLLCAASFAAGVCCGKCCGGGGGGGGGGGCGLIGQWETNGPNGPNGHNGPRGGDVDVQAMRWNVAGGSPGFAGFNLGSAKVQSKVMIVGPDGKTMIFDDAMTPEMQARIKAAMEQAMAGGAGGAMQFDIDVQMSDEPEGEDSDSDDDA